MLIIERVYEAHGAARISMQGFKRRATRFWRGWQSAVRQAPLARGSPACAIGLLFQTEQATLRGRHQYHYHFFLQLASTICNIYKYLMHP